jgi:uncharacterized protein
MKKMLLVLMFCIPFLMNGYSQTKQESIKQLFQLMQQDSAISKMMGSVMPMITTKMDQMPDSASRSMANEKIQFMVKTVENMTTRMINEDMVGLYDQYFTQKEIKDLIVFYKSSAGKKMVQVTPDIQKDLMLILIKKYLPELQNTLKGKL